MPARSQKQFKFFKMLANNPKRAKEVGMSPEAADEYTKGNKGKYSYANLRKESVKRK